MPKIEKQNQQLSDYEAEINLLRRRVEGLDNDKDRDRKRVDQVTDTLNRTRIVCVGDVCGFKCFMSSFRSVWCFEYVLVLKM